MMRKEDDNSFYILRFTFSFAFHIYRYSTRRDVFANGVGVSHMLAFTTHTQISKTCAMNSLREQLFRSQLVPQ